MIGIIGYGNMGAAIAAMLKSKYRVIVFDKDSTKTKGVSDIQAAAGITDLAKDSKVIILAVKPQDFDHLLREMKNSFAGKLLISIAAGVSTRHIEAALKGARVIRAMPNLGVRIAESVTCFCRGANASGDDLDFARQLFYYLGVARQIPESLMNAATAICGSAPAYCFNFIAGNNFDPQNIPQHAQQDMCKRLERAAEAVGFACEEAVFLSMNTVNSSINLLKKTKISAAELIRQVTSKGGTTEKALEVINKGGSWEEAALAALKRAEELYKKG